MSWKVGRPTLQEFDICITVHTMAHKAFKRFECALTHWGRATHTCVSKLTIIDPDNCLTPDRHQAIIWINSGILFIRTLGSNFGEIDIYIFLFWFYYQFSLGSSERFTKCIMLTSLSIGLPYNCLSDNSLWRAMDNRPMLNNNTHTIQCNPCRCIHEYIEGYEGYAVSLNITNPTQKEFFQLAYDSIQRKQYYYEWNSRKCFCNSLLARNTLSILIFLRLNLKAKLIVSLR